MAHNFNTIEGTEVFNVNDAVQGSHALTLDDVKNFVTGTLSDTLHSNETQTVPYTGTELPTTVGVNVGDTNTTQFSDGTVVDYTFDGVDWIVNFTQSPTSNIFPDSYGQNVRMATAIIRPTVDGSGNVTWAFIDDADHDPLYFTGLSTPTPNIVRVAFPPVTKVLSLHVSCDDHTNRYGIVAGASVGLSSADIFLSASFQTHQVISYNGSNWTNSGYVHTSSVTNSGTSIIVNRSSGGFANIESSYADTYAMYAGTNNRVLRHVYSGLGYFQNRYELVDPVTGVAQAPSVGDVIILFNPNLNYTMNTQTTNTSTGIEKHIYDGSVLPNFWITGVFVE